MSIEENRSKNLENQFKVGFRHLLKDYKKYKEDIEI